MKWTAKQMATRARNVAKAMKARRMAEKAARTAARKKNKCSQAAAKLAHCRWKTKPKSK